MEAPREHHQKNSDYRDRQRFEDHEDHLETHEPKEHLHQNYRHWAWLPKPK